MCVKSELRSRNEVLWSFAASYATALVAYAHLMRSIQKDRNAATTVYRLMVFIIFPLYPCFVLAQNLATALWRKYRRTRPGHHLRTYFWSNFAGLHVVTVYGSSEPFSLYEGWRAEIHPLDESPLARLGRAAVLAVTSVQAIGLFVRLVCRLLYFHNYDAFDGMAISDFEGFQISIGLLAVLAMSWAAFLLNTTWQEDQETLPGPKRLHSERFWRSDKQAVARGVRWIALRGSMAGLLGIAVLYTSAIFYQISHSYSYSATFDGRFFGQKSGIAELTGGMSWRASRCIYLLCSFFKISLSVIVPGLLWLRSGDSEATPGGLTLAIHGFFASIFGTAWRIYYQVNGDVFVEEPLSLTLVLVLATSRWLMLRCFRMGPWTKAARVSRVVLLCAWILLTIPVPAFVLTWFQLSPDECADAAKKDPLWTPSF